MDTRSAVCTLVAHDVVLGPLLDTGSNGRQHGRHPLRGIPAGSFIVLEWTGLQDTSATARSSLTVRSHLPRRQSADRSFADFLLHRVRALLTTGTIIVGNERMLDVRYCGTSHEFAAGDVDTIYKCSTFQIGVCRVRDRSTRLQLVPSGPEPIAADHRSSQELPIRAARRAPAYAARRPRPTAIATRVPTARPARRVVLNNPARDERRAGEPSGPGRSW